MIFINVQGARVPALGLGTWQLWGHDCRRIVAEALEIGYRHIDTAQMYENEQQVGQAVRESRVDRKDLFVTTKIGQGNLAAADVHRSFAKSLQDLGMEYVDLLLIHWPNKAVPLEETLDAMLEIKDEGRARHIGVSNFTEELFERAAAHAPIFCNQVEYHPFLAQGRLLELTRRHDAILTAYSPIARGRVAESKLLKDIGERYGKSPIQVTLHWLIQQEHVTAIPKASSRKHLQSNFEIFDFALSEGEMAAVASLAEGERVVNPVTAPWNE